MNDNVETPTKPGIDRIYHTPTNNISYIIAEVKYGIAKLKYKNGIKHMSDEWVEENNCKRLIDFTDKETAMDIIENGYRRELTCVDEHGNANTIILD